MSDKSKEIYQKCFDLEKEKQELKEANYSLRMQMYELANDLKGVARIIEVIHNVNDYNDEEANISAFANIRRLIEDISASMYASSKEEKCDL